MEPRLGIDGWTYAGTDLEECFPAPVEAELATLVHGLCRGMGTPYGFERAAQILESQKSYVQAYAVLEAYIASTTDPDPALIRWRARLARAVLDATP